jgi:hypothetical protein
LNSKRNTRREISSNLGYPWAENENLKGRIMPKEKFMQASEAAERLTIISQLIRGPALAVVATAPGNAAPAAARPLVPFVK